MWKSTTQVHGCICIYAAGYEFWDLLPDDLKTASLRQKSRCNCRLLRISSLVG